MDTFFDRTVEMYYPCTFMVITHVARTLSCHTKRDIVPWWRQVHAPFSAFSWGLHWIVRRTMPWKDEKTLMTATKCTLASFFRHCAVCHVMCFKCRCLNHSTTIGYTRIQNPHLFLSLYSYSQQKNTCAHNNTQKAHANGIKKKKRTKYVSTRGMDPKFLRNQKFAKKYNHSKREHD